MSDSAPCADRAFLGIPGYFRGCCNTAKHGGDLGYSHPGTELMRHVLREVPLSYEDDEWELECEVLFEHLAEHRFLEAHAWFVKFYPRCMALVPVRRRKAFIKGVFQQAARDEHCEDPWADGQEPQFSLH